MAENIALEVRFQGETQIYNPSCRTSWQDLMAMLKCSFDTEDIVVVYVDEEEDEIAIDAQEEYDEAKKISSKCHNVLRLRVYPKDPGMEVDLAPADGPVRSQASEETNARKRPRAAPQPQKPTTDATPPPPAPPPRPVAPPRVSRATSVPSKKQASVTGCVKKAVAELKQLNAAQPSLPNTPIKERELIDQIVKGVLEGLDDCVLDRTRPHSWDPSQRFGEVRAPLCTSPQPIPQGTRPKTRSPSKGPKLDHIGVSCSNCHSIVSGTRYKCGHCLEFDLCEDCEALSGIHDPNHVFLKLKRPAYRVGMKSDGRMAPILKHPVYADDDSPVWEYKIKKLEEKMARKAARAELKRKYREEKRRAKIECQGHVTPTKRERIERMAETQAKLIMTAARMEATPATRGTAAETTPLLMQNFEASFVRDGNLPDETHVQPRTKFVKSWIMSNTGNIIWNSDTKLKYLWGDIKILGSDPMEIPLLAPGEEGPICVDFEAPASPGHYQSHWRLTQKGEQFGHRVWCNIIVDVAEVLEPSCETRKTLQEEMILPTVLENVLAQAEIEDNTASSAVAHLQTDQADCDVLLRVVSSSDLLTAQDVLSFEMLNINDDRDADKEVEGVNSPATMATPNNTPIVGLTPCISPVPQLDEKLLSRRVSEHSDLEIINREDVPNIIETRATTRDGPLSELAQDGVEIADSISENEDEVESMCSSSDSCDDILDDYYVVPLPDCFDPSKPIDKSMILSRTSLSSSMTSSGVLRPSSENTPLVRLPSYEESQAAVERSTSPVDSLTSAPEAEETPIGTFSMAEDDSSATSDSNLITSSESEQRNGDDVVSDQTVTTSVDALLSTSNPALETVPLIPIVAAVPLQQLSATASPTPKSTNPFQQTVTMAPMPEITLLATPTVVQTTSEGGVLINPEGRVLYETRVLYQAPIQPEVVSETQATTGSNEGTDVDLTERATQPQEVLHRAEAQEQQTERPEDHEEFHDAQDTPDTVQDTPDTVQDTPETVQATPGTVQERLYDDEYQTDPVELLGYTAARAVEVAGSVVRHAFDSAASSVNALLRPQPIPMPAPYEPPSPSPMDQLIEMGFGDRDRNRQLLERYNDNVSRCVQDLLAAEDNEWQNNRH